jgi:hypothetical protein
MAEYSAGGITQKELGEKHGFHHRQLASWYKKYDLYDEYLNINSKNRSTSSKKTMKESSKLKITGVNSIDWKGQKIDTKHGLISGIYIPSPDHPNANQQGYVYEHRLVVEENIGRYLKPDEIVHHIDLDPTNNKIDNLLVLDSSEHTTLHYYMQLALVQLLPPQQLQQLAQCLLKSIRDEPNPRKKCDVKRRSNCADG